jgi:hypothetical protein
VDDEVPSAAAEPRDPFAGLGLSAAARARMHARAEAAEARKTADAEVKRAISGEPYGEYDAEGVWRRSTWTEVRM